MKTQGGIQTILLIIALSSLAVAMVARKGGAPDTSTLSNVLDLQTTHFNLEIEINFEDQIISGRQTLSMVALKDNVKVLELDVSSIEVISVVDQDNNQLEFSTIFPEPNLFGEQLRIILAEPTEESKEYIFTIEYSTNESEAISWLTPHQTASKVLPYLYTQCETVACRSIAPFQDTPYIKSTYTAQVTVQEEINVYLSANKTSVQPDPIRSGYKIHSFSCDIPIPSYLLAIVAGNVVEQQLGPRTYVITEPTYIEAYAVELIDLELYLSTVESIVTPYVWGTYKIVIQPPSFPIGGMENPLLTFASPSIMAGDKSGISVAVHEIAHSWSGNLVTCKNWSNLWLNEGFTMYLERTADAIMFGEEYSIVDAIVGNDTMVEDIKNFGFSSNYTQLEPIVAGANPDDSFSNIPYEKGFQFLKYIESIIGVESFQGFLKTLFTSYKFQSVEQSQVQRLLYSYIQKTNPSQSIKIIAQINWNAWVKSPGMPLVNLAFNTEAVPAIRELAQSYLDSQGDPQYISENWSDFYSYSLNEKCIFLQYLFDHLDQLTLGAVTLIDENYDLTNSTNKEIVWRWIRTSVRVHYEKTEKSAEDFLGSIGRIKMISPVYQALNESGKREEAIRLLNKYQDFYHPLAVVAIQRVLGLNN